MPDKRKRKAKPTNKPVADQTPSQKAKSPEGAKKPGNQVKQERKARRDQRNREVTDRMMRKVIRLLKEGNLIPQAVKTLGYDIPPMLVRKKIMDVHGENYLQSLLFPHRLSLVVNKIIESKNAELMDNTTATLEDALVRLKQKRSELK